MKKSNFYPELVVKLRSRSQVRSRAVPRSGPKGPRTKAQRPAPGLYTKFGLPGYGRGLAVKLRLGKVQVRSGPGLVQFTAQI